MSELSYIIVIKVILIYDKILLVLIRYKKQHTNLQICIYLKTKIDSNKLPVYLFFLLKESFAVWVAFNKGASSRRQLVQREGKQRSRGRDNDLVAS